MLLLSKPSPESLAIYSKAFMEPSRLHDRRLHAQFRSHGQQLPNGPVLVTEPPVGCGVDYVWCCDLFDLCAALPSASVDMILADLPYGVLSETAWDRPIPIGPMWNTFKRIIKPQGAIVLTAKQPFSSDLIVGNRAQYRYSWYWEKSSGANVAQVNYRPLMVIEEVLVFSASPAVFSAAPTMNYYPQKAKLEHPYTRQHKAEHVRITRQSEGAFMRNPERGIGTFIHEETYPRNLFYFENKSFRDATGHPTQKPVALFEYLIRTYTQPGDLVLDPVVGSGTTALAARNTGRHFICGDSSAEYVEIAKARLAEPYTLPLFEEPPKPPQAIQGSLFDE